MSGLNFDEVTLEDVQCMLHVMRRDRDEIIDARATMVERLGSIGDGEKQLIEAEISLATAEIHVRNTIIAKLWAILAGINVRFVP